MHPDSLYAGMSVEIIILGSTMNMHCLGKFVEHVWGRRGERLRLRFKLHMVGDTVLQHPEIWDWAVDRVFVINSLSEKYQE